MSKEKTENIRETPFALRIPKDLKDKLQERANSNRRSLNQEIVTILERFADSREVMVISEEPSQESKHNAS